MLRGLTALSFFVVLTMGGCGGGSRRDAYITLFPRWDWEAYDRLAVVPVEHPRGKRGAGQAAAQMANVLEDELAANGNFTLLDRNALSKVLTEQDLSRLAGVADPRTVLPPGKIQAAQAIVVGEITEFELARDRTEHRLPIYAKDKKGRIRRDRKGRRIIDREIIIEVFEHRATVGGRVRVIDAATGKVILAHKVPPITHERRKRGSPPDMTPADLAIEAAKELAVDCYKHIAPIRSRIKLDSDNLIVALDYYDGKYAKTKKVSTELDNFMLAVRELPSGCNRNAFRVAIAPEDARNIWEEKFVWSSHNPVRGKSWTIPVQLLKSAGQEKFVAKLYAAGAEQPMLERDFKLEPPDKND